MQPRLIVSFALAVYALSASADSVYVVDDSNQFGTVDLGTGAFRQIGPNTPEEEVGLAQEPNGSLLTLSVSGNLDSINPVNGVTTVVGPTGLGDCSLPTSPCGPTSASAIAALAGTVYATDLANNLYKVNPLTGAATLIGPTGIPPLPFKLLASNPDGTFNAYDQALFGANGKLYATFDAFTVNSTTFTLGSVVIPGSLYQIDPTTGIATLIGPTDLNLGAVANVNGIFYAFNNGTSQIVSLDLLNGNTSAVGNFDPAAGIVTGASSVPEPGSVALVGIGVFGIAVWKRRRRSDLRKVRMSTIGACTLLGILCIAAIPTQAASFAISYSLTGMGTVVASTATTLTLLGEFSGSVLSGNPSLNTAWNPVAYTDNSVADLTTGLLNGNFTMTFANGDTLMGDVSEDVAAIVASPDGTGAFTQSLTFTGGTGEFAGATGSTSGSGFVGTTVGTVSGNGTLDAPAVPEPSSIAFVGLGVLGIAVWTRRRKPVMQNRVPVSPRLRASS